MAEGNGRGDGIGFESLRGGVEVPVLAKILLSFGVSSRGLAGMSPSTKGGQDIWGKLQASRGYWTGIHGGC